MLLTEPHTILSPLLIFQNDLHGLFEQRNQKKALKIFERFLFFRFLQDTKSLSFFKLDLICGKHRLVLNGVDESYVCDLVPSRNQKNMFFLVIAF